jgi:putative phosphoribosyl transferase
LTGYQASTIGNLKPEKIVVSVAVSPKETARRFAQEVDDFVAVTIPDIFWGAIGYYYDDFSQVSDEEVVALLKNHEDKRKG